MARDDHFAGSRSQPIHDAIEQCAFAAPIRPQQHEPFAGMQIDRNVFDNRSRAIARAQSEDLQHRVAHGTRLGRMLHRSATASAVQPTSALIVPTAAETRKETLNTISSNPSIALPAAINPHAGSRKARVSVLVRIGAGASQRRAARLTEITALDSNTIANSTPNSAMAIIASSAFVPMGIMTRTGMTARATPLGCAHANICLTGQPPRLRSDG